MPKHSKQQFKEQGGASTMDPGPIRRWITSKMMTLLSSEARQIRKRNSFEAKRSKAGMPHVVEYFHDVNDGYSYLTAQVLKSFANRYKVKIICHIVGAPVGDNSPEPELLSKLSRYDSYHVAPHYGLEFPKQESALDVELSQQASSILAVLRNQDFIETVAEVSEALWNTNKAKLNDLAASIGELNDKQTVEKISEGNERRAELKHYSSAMFYYGGEWYWGVDRLHHLEHRLRDLGLDKQKNDPEIVPRPKVTAQPLKDNGSLTLEIYPSLRSPYSAISFDRSVAYAKEVGINLKVRPVLPMVMRGASMTREKGSYIFFDTSREARAEGIKFGPCSDPIGEPVRRAYSLFTWAEEQGKSVELMSSFFQCAWVDAINTNNDKGMKKVVERAGLDWSHAMNIIGQDGWQEVVEENRLAMYEMGLWGVPSFRLLNHKGEPHLQLWGQDRLWVIAKEVQTLLKAEK